MHHFCVAAALGICVWYLHLTTWKHLSLSTQYRLEVLLYNNLICEAYFQSIVFRTTLLNLSSELFNKLICWKACGMQHLYANTVKVFLESNYKFRNLFQASLCWIMSHVNYMKKGIKNYIEMNTHTHDHARLCCLFKTNFDLIKYRMLAL